MENQADNFLDFSEIKNDGWLCVHYKEIKIDILKFHLIIRKLKLMNLSIRTD